ncbi:MAG TPA: NPCBM/NEW2 domain-containing protein [Pyrinomonadaceae bacterium]|nr:NPCBM/NEW2 domain-containing protein [Pyrinomonadaceae bacterium]
MKTITCSLLLLILLVAANTAQVNSHSQKVARAVAKKTWPHAIPLRVRDGSNKDLFVMTLGDVETSLADGSFDPRTDEVTLKDGTVIKNYYRDKLGVKYFKPVDKSLFALPPSGWCTWYYYYQQINEKEVKLNAQWIAEHLKQFGAQYVQIDDGWQGTGRVYTRDWTNVSDKFPGGMDHLASHIKSLGLTPGLWLAPHGQSNETVVKKQPGIFLLKPDGTSASETWEGRFLLDPSNAESQAYLKDLFSKLSGWGYEYFKIDGQPVVTGEYRLKKAAMKNPSDDTAGLYRQTLESIRAAIGPNRYLLGCWGMPIEGVGIMNGSRTGGDIVLGWENGFMIALRATMQNYYLHNVAWYTDPDVMLVRSPLRLDQARSWATLQGLTGQALLGSDRMMDLSEDRVELLRRVYPAVDIRPLDLFPSERNKRIWDLKIKHLDRSYDVVGLFNFDEERSEKFTLNWKELGLPESTVVHVYDFWNKEYLGAWGNGMTVDLSPTSTRVLTLLPSTEKIQLISTSRHITQGWIDLVAVNQNDAANSFTGKSKVIKDDPYVLSFVFPRGKNFRIKTATAKSGAGSLPVKISNYQGWATARINPSRTTQIDWSIGFEAADSYHYPVREPASLWAEHAMIDGISLRWPAQYYLNAGYQVFLNGRLLGYTPNNAFVLRGLDPEATYTAEVRTVWEDGTASEKKTELKFTIKSLLPQELSLSSLDPAVTGRGVRSNRALTGRPLSIGGQRFETGLGSRANTEIEYELRGLFAAFSAFVGLDDANNNEQASAEFVVLGDGKELWRSGLLKKSDGAKSFRIDIAGVKRLVLRVSGGGDTPGRLLADWAEPRITRTSAKP